MGYRITRGVAVVVVVVVTLCLAPAIKGKLSLRASPTGMIVLEGYMHDMQACAPRPLLLLFVPCLTPGPDVRVPAQNILNVSGMKVMMWITNAASFTSNTNTQFLSISLSLSLSFTHTHPGDIVCHKGATGA